MDYYITDIETGHKTPVTKEQYERYRKFVDAIQFVAPIKIKPLIFGTGGGFDNTNDIKNLFTKSTINETDTNRNPNSGLIHYFCPAYNHIHSH